MLKCILCDKVARYRGLCQWHYDIFRRLVKRGETTWDKLVEGGWALVAKPRVKPPWR